MAINNKLEILYEDNSIIVCVKPSGVSSQTERGYDPDMVSILSNYLAASSPQATTPYVGVIHRLDKPVCGVMVYAKTKSAAANLSNQLAGSSFSKHYYAIVLANESILCDTSATLKNYLLQDVKSNTSSVVDSKTPGAKEAVLEYTIIKTLEYEGLHLALLDIHLLTGRHHQIRVQLSHTGIPILGDKKYGKSIDNLPFKIKRTGLALCAYNLSFTHPDTKDVIKFSTTPKSNLWEIVL